MRITVASSSFVLALVAALGCDASRDALPTGALDLEPRYAKPSPTLPGVVIVVLPKIAAGYSDANAINDAEEIVGTDGGPVRWTKSGSSWIAQRLGTSPGTAVEITEAGTAVVRQDGNIMLWRRNGSTEVVAAGYAVALNESETVIGYDSNNRATAWVRTGASWSAHTLRRYQDAAAGINEPSDINDAGIIVGYSSNSSNIQHAVKWIPSTTSPGEWDVAVPVDELAGTTNSAALGIEGNDIVGLIWRCVPPDSNTACASRDARHWSLTPGSSLGSLSSADAWPEGLNSSQFIVGVTFPRTRPSSWNAFVWSPGAPTLQNLGAPKGYASGWAKDINNSTTARQSKEIVGYAETHAGANAAVVWIIP
jgi:hypothetical protein